MRIDPQALRRHVYERWMQTRAAAPRVGRFDYTFDMPLAGDGWHTRESDGTCFWRFTGPGERATIHLPPLADTVRTLAFDVIQTVSAAHPHELTVRCNGVHLDGGRFDGRTITFTIAPEAVRGHDATHLEIITLPALRPSGDARALGLAFSAIRIA
jgi:hypothetical protein